MIRVSSRLWRDLIMNKAPFGAKTIAILHRIALPFFYIFLRSTFGLYCRIRFRPRYFVPPEVRKLKTPYIVLADHVHPMDMFINGLALRPVIHWVAADANFRTPFMKFGMTVLAGAVAKAKNRSDMVTLSQLKLLTDIGSVIGIYQEGERSWDGVSLPPVKGTDKLIRFLKVPVVYAHLEGAYLEHPRWTWSGNRTPINVRYEIIISRDDVQTMPLSEITRRITEAGSYDEWAYQKEAQIPLKGDRRAENVELVCFLCPGCHSVNTIHSEGNDFACSSCGLEGSINEMGSFAWAPGTAIRWPGNRAFSTVREWNLWQADFYHEEMEKVYGLFGDGLVASVNPSTYLFWEDLDSVILSRGKRGRMMKTLGIGTARFFGDRIEFESPAGSVRRSDDVKLSIPLDDISSFSVFKQFYAEFYYNKELYQFSFTNRSVSGYKWLVLFNMIVDHKQNRL